MEKTIIMYNQSNDERWEIRVSTNQWACWWSNKSVGKRAVDLQSHTLEAMEIEAVEQFKLWISEEEFNKLEKEMTKKDITDAILNKINYDRKN